VDGGQPLLYTSKKAPDFRGFFIRAHPEKCDAVFGTRCAQKQMDQD
jgi:hypothetical protein